MSATPNAASTTSTVSTRSLSRVRFRSAAKDGEATKTVSVSITDRDEEAPIGLELNPTAVAEAPSATQTPFPPFDVTHTHTHTHKLHNKPTHAEINEGGEEKSVVRLLPSRPARSTAAELSSPEERVDVVLSRRESSRREGELAKEGLLPRVAAVRALSSPFCLPSSLNRHCSWSLPLSPFKLLLPPSHATSRSSTHRRRRRSEQRKRGRTTGKEGSHPRHHHRATLTANEASVVVVAERGLLLLSWPSSLPLQLHSILNCWNSPLVPIETFATNGSLRYKTAIGDIYKYYVDGHWKKSSSGKSVPIINPTARNTHYKVQVKFERDKERGVVAHRRAVLRKESQVAEHSRRLHAIETRINQDSSKMRKIVAKVSNLHRVKCIKLMQT